MFKRSMIVIAAAFAVTGCAAPYVAPTSGPTAKLTVLTATDKWDMKSVANVTVAPKTTADGCGKFAQNMDLTSFDKEDFALTIAADNDIFFNIQRPYGGIYCKGTGMFHATSGKEYLLNIRFDNGYCYAALTEKTQAGAVIPVKISRAYASSWDGIEVCPN